MKRFLIAIAALASILGSATIVANPSSTHTNEEADVAAVVAVIKDYLAVVDERDSDAAARSFHPAASLVSVTPGGAVNYMSQDVWLERTARIPEGAPERVSTIVNVDVVGSAATARVDFGGENSSTDMFLLVKTKRGWRITQKALSAPL